MVVFYDTPALSSSDALLPVTRGKYLPSENAMEQLRKKTFDLIDVNNNSSRMNRCYDFLSTGILLLNLLVSTLMTFTPVELQYGAWLTVIEDATVVFFAADCLARMWTANYLYPQYPYKKALRKYCLSFSGIVDILSWAPYFPPFFFPGGAPVFRLFRAARIFRLFRVNAYYDSMNIIYDVLRSKKNQLMSCLFIILVMMFASSLCMYSLENAAQPEVFRNALSGIWWSVSTLLTVGYGDIYPITYMGKLFGTIITFLGVALVAIPTGILSAGFVDQYSRMKRITEYGREHDVHFIKIPIFPGDSWENRTIRELRLPTGLLVAVILRNNKAIVPKGDTLIHAGDIIVTGAESYRNDIHIELKEIELKPLHPWSGRMIRDLDISRQTIIIMIRRNGQAIMPKGSTVLLPGDTVIFYSQSHIENETPIEL